MRAGPQAVLPAFTDAACLARLHPSGWLGSCGSCGEARQLACAHASCQRSRGCRRAARAQQQHRCPSPPAALASSSTKPAPAPFRAEARQAGVHTPCGRHHHRRHPPAIPRAANDACEPPARPRIITRCSLGAARLPHLRAQAAAAAAMRGKAARASRRLPHLLPASPTTPAVPPRVLEARGMGLAGGPGGIWPPPILPHAAANYPSFGRRWLPMEQCPQVLVESNGAAPWTRAGRLLGVGRPSVPPHRCFNYSMAPQCPNDLGGNDQRAIQGLAPRFPREGGAPRVAAPMSAPVGQGRWGALGAWPLQFLRHSPALRGSHSVPTSTAVPHARLWPPANLAVHCALLHRR